MSDQIRIVGMSFLAYHGVSKAEQNTGRKFEVDCELELDLASAGKSDRLRETVDYGQVFSVVKKVMEGTPVKLLEHLAEMIATDMLAKWPVDRVRVAVRKLHPPVGGVAEFVEVKIDRRRA